MQKVILVEDNHTIRQGLSENIPWSDNDILVAGIFDNGLDAFEYLKSNNVDVVITDIVMPLMDGLDLTKEVKKLYPSVKIILLSAFNEFEYAKNAIRFGVFDYITKPIDNELLLNTVKMALKEKRKDEILKDQVKRSLPVLREKLLTRLVRGYYEKETISDECEYLNLQFNFDYYKCILFEIDHLEKLKKEINIEELQVYILKIAGVISDNFSDFSPVQFSTDDNYIIILLGSSELDNSDSYHSLYEKLEKIKDEVESKFRMTLTIGVGNQVPSIREIGESYKNALDALEVKFSMGCNKVFDIKDVKLIESGTNFNLPVLIQKDIVQKIKYGNKPEVIECINKLREFLCQQPIRKEFFKLLMLNILSEFLQKVYEMEINKKDLFDLQFKILTEIDELVTQEEILNELEKFFITLYEYIGELRSGKNQKIINNVKEYINKSYSKEDIGLDEIAKRVSLSPSYLSAVFKEETGKNFIEYITDIRMAKAQELLSHSDMKIYEVSLNIGYTNQFYFSACFKKYTGMSPNEFRNKVSQVS